MGLPDSQTFLIFFIHSDTIPECDRQPDRHLSTGKTRYAYMRHAVKKKFFHQH